MDLKNSNLTIRSEASEAVTEMRRRTRHVRMYDVIMGTLTVLSGAGFFFVLDRSIGESSWFVAFCILSLYVITYLVFAVTSATRRVLIIAVIISFLTSFLFMFSISHAVVLVIASLLLWRSVVMTRRGLFQMIRVRPSHAMHLGVMSFLFALTLIISSQYYGKLSQMDSTSLVERITRASTSHIGITEFVTQKVFPIDPDVVNTPFTVDSMLRSVVTSGKDSGGENSASPTFESIDGKLCIDPQFIDQAVNSFSKSVPNDTLVRGSRDALSKNVGFALDGSERISDVAKSFFTLRITELVVSNPLLSNVVAFMLMTLLFLTLVSVFSLIRFPWIWISSLVFIILKYFGVIKTLYEKKEVEVIKY